MPDILKPFKAFNCAQQKNITTTTSQTLLDECQLMGVPGYRVGWAAAQRRNEEEKRVRERGGWGGGSVGGKRPSSLLSGKCRGK